MIFQYTLDAVLSGAKTQTRRLVKTKERGLGWLGIEDEVRVVHIPNERVKWRIGRTYAVQPGRGKPAVARFLLKSIRLEVVNDISEEDAIAEGAIRSEGYTEGGWTFPGRDWNMVSARAAFLAMWREVHGPDSEWLEAWVLDFELVRPAA